MIPEQRSRLQEIVQDGKLGTIFKDIDQLARRIETFAAHYAEKSKGVPRGALPSTLVSLDGVVAEFRSNPYRVQVLLQAMAFGCTPEMLAMIWMSELGCTIQKLTLDYERRDRAVLQIQLRLLDASTLEFRSTEVWDLAVLRLVGLAESDDKPEMSGFYPLSLPASSLAEPS
ncbi:MAG TPA: hypothetical protein VGD37_04395 [Kofleriaceae bacterium]|jgi:hypothetical protein